MANYLRKDKRAELKVDRVWRKEEKIKRRGCPHCQSRSIVKINNGWQCHNCHRLF